MTTLRKMMISFTAGAVLGILYAPAKGTKTRRKLAGFGSNIKDGWNNISDKVASGIDYIKGNEEPANEPAVTSDLGVNDKAGYL